ncbi:DUF4369 domain-containing protein [Tenacibaculum jejuense]|uniref:Thiol:disulfide interchange protein n=1 Tax=Tenacibaculum jejuense TaxID=584609 RepID=A0A238U9C8_9FLAO|nr:DUF4369 domain-containing protein [Tenacibaculum jejuense]SNR15020.1 Thiol:disulfide interchange protein [Tenacibaculum jejuense]
MKKIIIACIVSLIAFSCSSKKKGNMVVKGEIKGIKKGTLYLQKMIDTVLVSADSIQLFGDNKFELSDNVDSPVMYYLTFKSGDNEPKKLMFFGEKGEIIINDEIEKFGFKPSITGSENQKVMDEFNKINHQFKMRRLDFIAKDIEARAKKDSVVIDSLEKAYKKMVRRRFLYTTNFAVSNADSEAAPYIALSELFDANIYLLDTINNSLTGNVKKSDYGKRLQKFIDDIKKSENETQKK